MTALVHRSFSPPVHPLLLEGKNKERGFFVEGGCTICGHKYLLSYRIETKVETVGGQTQHVQGPSSSSFIHIFTYSFPKYYRPAKGLREPV